MNSAKAGTTYLVVLGIAFAFSACSHSETLPVAASLYITAEPAAANQPLQLDLHEGSGDSYSSVAVAQGERVVVRMSTLPGAYTISSSEGCTASISLAAGIETDVVLIQDGAPCSFEVATEHPSDRSDHIFGSASVTLNGDVPPSDLSISVVSLDVPPNPVPPPIHADEGGNLYFPEIVPGEYRFVAMSGELTLGSRIVNIEPDPASNSVAIEITGSP